ncbi:Hypothetical protein, putative, partial [Bodo saltans]
ATVAKRYTESTPTSSTVPSTLSALGSSDVFPCPVVYSLDFSNQVLVADLNSGAVRLLDEYPCRPSCIFTDGSIVAVGDGRGRVHAYRGSALAVNLWTQSAAAAPTTPIAPSTTHGVLWNSAVSLHPVTLIESVHHAYIIAATSNYNIFVLDASTGVMLSSLIAESCPLRYVLSHQGPITAGGATEVTLHFDSGVVSTFRCAQPSGGETWSLTSAYRRPASQRCGAQIWSAKHQQLIDLCGTSEGQVQLYAQHHRGQHNGMISQVDVNDAVIAVHVLPRPEDPHAITVVCTSNGSLWQWTMAELDLTAEDDAQQEPQAADFLPAASAVDAEQDRIDELVDEVRGARRMDDDEQQHDVVIEMEVDDAATYAQGEEVLIDDDEAISIAATQNSAVPSSVALTAATHDTTREEMLRQRYRPNHNVRFAQTIGQSENHVGEEEGLTTTSVVERREVHTEVTSHHGGATNHHEQQQRTPSSNPRAVSNSTAHQQVATKETSSLTTASQQQHSAVSIPGLKQGRRWDPRRIEAALTRQTDDASDSRAAFSVPVDQSTAAVEAEDARLAQQEFDYEQYAAAHPLETNALRHMNPIKGVVYHKSEVLFSSLSPRGEKQATTITETNKSQRGDTAHIAERALFSSPSPVVPPVPSATDLGAGKFVGDDLVDATFLKFAQRRDAQQRKRQQAIGAGPNIRDHLVHDLLVAPPNCAPAAIFFTEFKVPLSDPPLLTMPMPLPPSAVSAW